jgi:HTH-type transcriptional regulator/antitoxin HigA
MIIATDQQRANTQEWVKRFQVSIADLRRTPGPADALEPAKREILIRSQESLLEDLECQIAEYDELRSGTVKRLTIDSFHEFGKTLIRARVAAGISPEEFAERLGIGMQEMERLERFEFQEATLARLFEIVRKLGVEIHCEIRLSEPDAAKKSRSRKRASTLAAD